MEPHESRAPPQHCLEARSSHAGSSDLCRKLYASHLGGSRLARYPGGGMLFWGGDGSGGGGGGSRDGR